MAQPRFRRYAPDVRAAMLVDAALACLARGGIAAFTIDNICREAGASRGLITHHFGSKEGLLAAVYAAAFQPLLDNLTAEEVAPLNLLQIIERVFNTSNFTRDSLNVWLALWGEVAANPALQAEHRKHYARYRATVARAIDELARARGIVVDAQVLAISVIALIDGLWLEQGIDPELLSPARSIAACCRMLEPILGPMPASS